MCLTRTLRVLPYPHLRHGPSHPVDFRSQGIVREETGPAGEPGTTTEVRTGEGMGLLGLLPTTIVSGSVGSPGSMSQWESFLCDPGLFSVPPGTNEG